MCSPMPDINPEDFETPEIWTELAEAEQEIGNQLEQWGEQNHPDLAPEPASWARRIDYQVTADAWKEANDYRSQRGSIAWDGILLEEVYEAVSEQDEDKMRTELIQVAAVALNWAGAIRRRKAARAA